MSIRNGIFVSVLCILIASPFCLFFVQEILRLDVPQQLTATEADYLSGVQADTDVVKNLSLAAFTKGALQNAVEDEIGSYFPAKASAILINAEIQRAFIGVSNSLFEWNYYPTFFGSNILFLPDDNALMRMPFHQSELASEMLHDFGVSLREFASKHTELRIHVVIADRSTTSEANPALSSITDPFDPRESFKLLDDALSSASNIDIVMCAYDSAREYFMNYYRTDHHWNGFGARIAYSSIGDGLVINKSYEDGMLYGGKNLVVNGSMARSGLDLLNEVVCEPSINVSHLAITNDVKAAILTYRGSVEELADWESFAEEYNFYHFWYGTTQETHIANTVPSKDTRSLLICDSYGSAFQWFIAGDYAETHSYYDLHMDAKGEYRLESHLKASEGISDIYIVGMLDNLASLKSRFPNYFLTQ